MKKHLTLSRVYPKEFFLDRTYCGLSIHAGHCTRDESQVTCKSCLRAKASWDSYKP